MTFIDFFFWVEYYLKCLFNIIFSYLNNFNSIKQYLSFKNVSIKQFIKHNKTKYKKIKKINEYFYIVKLSGSYYSMGKQYGYKTKYILKKDIQTIYNFIEKNKSIFIKKIPNKYKDKSIFIALKNYYKDIYNYLNQDIINFIKGICDAINIDFDILMGINLFSDLTDNHCILLSKSINNKLLNIRTLDFGMPLLTQFLIVFKPKNKIPYISLNPSVFCGCYSGISAKNIFFGESYYDILLSKQSIIGIPFHHLSHKILSESYNLKEAEELLKKMDRKSNLQLLISDAKHSKLFLSGKDVCTTQQNSKTDNTVYSVTPNEKENFDKNFHHLTDIDTIINTFIPNTRSGELHIFISYDGNIYVSVTTKLFQSYNNDFYKFSIISLIK